MQKNRATETQEVCLRKPRIAAAQEHADAAGDWFCFGPCCSTGPAAALSGPPPPPARIHKYPPGRRNISRLPPSSCFHLPPSGKFMPAKNPMNVWWTLKLTTCSFHPPRGPFFVPPLSLHEAHGNLLWIRPPCYSGLEITCFFFFCPTYGPLISDCVSAGYRHYQSLVFLVFFNIFPKFNVARCRIVRTVIVTKLPGVYLFEARFLTLGLLEYIHLSAKAH